MNAATQTPGGQVTGPDHAQTSSSKLQDQAATAALYVTNTPKQSKDIEALGPDNKLSSAGAATSLKYANPRDLPSFPSAGLPKNDSSAFAAANLANASQKSFEYWKPGYSEPANKAAAIAKDYKMEPLWKPSLSAGGSKAALLAAHAGANVDIWKPEPTVEGSSAAEQAMHNKHLSPIIDHGYTEDGSNRALRAATGAMSGRKRAGSSPVVDNLYPDSANSAANALNAATTANNLSRRKGNKSNVQASDLPGLSQTDATRIHNAAITNLGRQMYSSQPPVALEVEEKNRQASLHAAAVSMAKKMFDNQNKTLESAAGIHRSDSHRAANNASSLRPFTSIVDDSPQAFPQYANLQEAAQKLASERLAKLHDANAAYRDYYGAQAPVVSRLSVRGRLRRRATSDGGLPESDEARSQRIRSETSLLNNKIAQVDAKKQQKDRDALMAAAQRNVQKKLHGMDEKMFADTGKVSPAMMAEWEAKAKARAEADSSARMVNHGKLSIGGGKYIDQSELDAIAAARVQPTLDEITAKAEAQRSRDERIRHDADERRQIAEERARDEKERNLKTKEDWRRFKEEEKREDRVRKAEEKVQRAEEKRLKGEERHPKAATSVVEKAVENTTQSSETPILDPVPKLAPIPVDLSERASEADRGESATSSRNQPSRTSTSDDNQLPAQKADSAEPTTEYRTIDPDSTISPEPITENRTTDPDSTTLPEHSEPIEQRIAPPLLSAEATAGEVPTTEIPASAAQPSSSSKVDQNTKLSAWLKTKFSRNKDKPSKLSGSETTPASTRPEGTTKAEAPSGHSSAANESTSTSHEDTVVGNNSLHEQSSRELGTSKVENPVTGRPYLTSIPQIAAHSMEKPSRSHSSSVSALSSDEPTMSEQDTRGRSSSQAQEHKSDGEGSISEEFEEAKDHFETDTLPLPSFEPGNRAGKISDSPVRDSRFKENL